MFSASGPPATCRGEARFARRPRPSPCGESLSQTVWSNTGVVKLTSASRKQKSTASAGFPATTCACVRTEFTVSLGALALRFESHVSMVRNDRSVTDELRHRRGREAGPVAPHHLVTVIAVGRVDTSAFGEAAPDIVDAECPERRR